MKKFSLLLILSIVLCATTSFADKVQPIQRLHDGVEKLVSIMNDPNYGEASHLNTKRNDALRVTIKSFFNFEELSKRSVGRPWLKFSSEERDEFVTLFTQLLEKTYLKKVTSYSNYKIAYDKQTIVKTKYAQIETRIITSDKQIPVNYRMKLVDGQWDVYDVKVEGISLVNNYKAQFSSILDTSTSAKFEASKKELFDRLTKKCHELDSATSDNSY